MEVYEFFKWLFLFSVSQLGLCLAANDRKPNSDKRIYFFSHQSLEVVIPELLGWPHKVFEPLELWILLLCHPCCLALISKLKKAA